LPEVLTRLGHLGTPDDGAQSPGASPARRFDPVKMIRDLLPKDFRKSLARRMPTALRDRLAQRVDTAGIDWSRTRAFCLPTDLEGYIRINLRGREPQGIVEPGEYESCAILRPRGTEEFVTGARSEVLRTDKPFRGTAAYLPDLIVQWDCKPHPSVIQRDRCRFGVSPDLAAAHRGPGLSWPRSGDRRARTRGGGIVDLRRRCWRASAMTCPGMRGRVWRK
jgi:hypothetical protein